MSTDTIFGAAVVGNDMLECVTRDGQEFKFRGPPNMPPNQHRARMRFAVGTGTWIVTFRKFDNSERWGEVSAEKDIPAMRVDLPKPAPPVDTEP